MINSPSVTTRASVRRRSWAVVAAAVAALGLLTAVAADGPDPSPNAPRTTSDDEGVYRRLVNEGHIPRPARDDVPAVTRRLVNEGQIPGGVLE